MLTEQITQHEAHWPESSALLGSWQLGLGPLGRVTGGSARLAAPDLDRMSWLSQLWLAVTSLVASHLLWYQFHRILNLLNKVVLSIWCLPHNNISKSFVFSGNKNNTLSTRRCTSKSFLHMHTYTITHHMHVCVRACVLSRSSPFRRFVTLWTVAHQAPLSREFSRREYWKALPCPPPGDLLNTDKIRSPSSPAPQVFLPLSPRYLHIYTEIYFIYVDQLVSTIAL